MIRQPRMAPPPPPWYLQRRKVRFLQDLLKVRPHRGLLADAMAEKRTFADFSEMVAFLEGDWARWGAQLTNITAKAYGFDKRIGWDTWIVTGEMQEGRIVLGFTNGPPLP